MKAHEVLENVTQTVALERNQGLDFEVRRLLPSGWNLEYRVEGYMFVGPWSEAWEDTVWRLVRNLSYKSMLSLRRSGVGNTIEYELVTCMENGTGFRAVFRSFSAT